MRGLSRRELLALVPAAVVGCRRAEALPASCADTSTLAAGDVSTRSTLGYADASPDPEKTCASCKQFVEPAAADACGACNLLKGPVHPRGTCKAYAPRT